MAAALGAFSAPAQGPVSATAGLLYMAEGEVYLDDKPLRPVSGVLLHVEQNHRVSTGAGRTELLLSPGNYLLLGENAEVRMLRVGLTDVCVEALRGSVLLDARRLKKKSKVELRCGETRITVGNRGAYRLVCGPGALQLKTFSGSALVRAEGSEHTVGSGHLFESADRLVKAFDRKRLDGFELWCAHRAMALDAAGGEEREPRLIAEPPTPVPGSSPVRTSAKRLPWYKRAPEQQDP